MKVNTNSETYSYCACLLTVKMNYMERDEKEKERVIEFLKVENIYQKKIFKLRALIVRREEKSK